MRNYLFLKNYVYTVGLKFVLKVVDTIGNYLVTSNGRGWRVTNYEKRLPLKWRSFRERGFPRIWCRDLRIGFWGLEIKHLKAHTFVRQGCVFCFIIISQLRRPIELKFSQVCLFMHMLRYTKWQDWSMTITNSVQCLWNTVEQLCCVI